MPKFKSEPTAVEQLQAEARADYKRHNTPETAAAFRLARGQAQVSGNTAGGSPRGPRA